MFEECEEKRATPSRMKFEMRSRASSKVLLSSLTKIVLLLALRLHEVVNATERFCPEEASVDLTDATQNATGFLSKTGHFFTIDVVQHTTDAFFGCICDIKTCVSVCSPLVEVGEPEIPVPEHSSNDSVEIPPVNATDSTREDDEHPFPVEFIFWDPCMGGPAYNLDYNADKIDTEKPLENGLLVLSRKDGTNTSFDWKEFCFEQQNDGATFVPRVCSTKPQKDVFKTANYIGGLVSAPFLIVTIFVYSVLPELRNIHGSIFRCYLCCLLLTYVTLAADRIPPSADNIETRCIILGTAGLTFAQSFAIYFSFLTSFFWLNVMCFDMWWRFAGCGTLRSGGNLQERKKFIGYSVYAWGTATVLTGICIGLEYSPVLPESVTTPGFTKLSCWFSTKNAEIFYYLGPVSLTIVCNIYLFVSTSIKMIQHKRNTQCQLSSSDSQRHHENKLLFSLYLKLFVIMGISWSTEVISGFWDGPKYVWYFTDMVNTLQGVLIFVLFVCKKKIWQSLKIRFECCS